MCVGRYRGGMTLRPRMAIVGVALALALAGCSGATDDAPTPTSTVSAPAATPTATPTPSDAADEAALRDLWDRYLAATVQALNGPDPDPALWQGIGGDEVIAGMTSTAQSYLDNDMAYTGAPRSVSLDVTVEGDSATLRACVDLSGWVAVSNRDDVLPTPSTPVVPRALEAQLQPDGSWLIVDDSADTSGVAC